MSNDVIISILIKCEIRGSQSLVSSSTEEVTYSRGRCLILVTGLEKMFLCVSSVCIPLTLPTPQDEMPYQRWPPPECPFPTTESWLPQTLGAMDFLKFPKNIFFPANESSMCSHRLWELWLSPPSVFWQTLLNSIITYLFTCFSVPLDEESRKQRKLFNFTFSHSA